MYELLTYIGFVLGFLLSLGVILAIALLIAYPFIK